MPQDFWSTHCTDCCSYNEVHQFEQNCSSELWYLTFLAFPPSSQFVQYVDNVDRNIRTLDGNDTFHGTGMIAAITPGIKKCHQVLRVKITATDIAAIGKVPIQRRKCKYNNGEVWKAKQFQGHRSYSFSRYFVEELSHVWITKTAWSGMMQLVHQGSDSGKSSVMFLPMIDMNPNDMACVYSTLKYIEDHACHPSVLPIVTFDHQPLWWKPMMVIIAEPVWETNIVLCLGGFH